MSDIAIPNRETFESMYSAKAPWDIGRPQKEFLAIAHQVRGSVLDAGCGTGENALYFAQRGHDVLGIDFLEFPIREAQRKSQERTIRAEFLQMDALTLTSCDRRFDSLIDSGLFHCFSDEDRIQYVAGLAHVLHSGGRLFLMCFSDEEPGTMGPRRISKADIEAAFAGGWTIESIEPRRFETRPDFTEMNFSEGGPKAWFVVVRRA